MQKLTIFRASGPRVLLEILHRHPGVGQIDWVEEERVEIAFIEGTSLRSARQGVPTIEGPYGLLELMDNNPLVCARHASCPGPAATLALIALGPLARAEMIADEPTLTFNFEDRHEEIAAALATEGWQQGYTISPANDPEKSRVLEGVIEVPLKEAVALEDIETLFDDVFGRTFFIRPASALPEEAVEGSPLARYEFEDYTAPPSPRIRIRVLADRDGKAGTAQVVHLFNVMAGFEEDLGLGEG
ncbi:MAG: hypothetical protein D6724_06860, partial [Armatimonadetes bacterium]